MNIVATIKREDDNSWYLIRGSETLGVAYSESDARLWAESYELLEACRLLNDPGSLEADELAAQIERRDSAIARAEGRE